METQNKVYFKQYEDALRVLQAVAICNLVAGNCELVFPKGESLIVGGGVPLSNDDFVKILDLYSFR